MKKIIYYLLAFLVIIVASIIIFELFLQILPVIGRNMQNNNNNKIYVYVLGESSAWGQPYLGKISFSKIMLYSLDNKIDNKKIDLIMIARPGSRLLHQYFRYLFYRYTHPFDKGIVLLYSGTNDFDTRRDTSSYRDISLKINIVGLFNNYINKQYDFKYEYERIILLAKSFGDDIYMSTIAGNYAGFMSSNVSSLSDLKLKENIDKIDNLILNKNYEEAMTKCKILLEQYENKAQIWYRVGKIYEGQKNIKEAKQAYLNVVECGNDTRPSQYQNDVIRNLAKKYKLPYMDIFDILNNSDEIVGYNFFIDKTHPTLRLHTIIAKGFVDLLSKKYNINIVNSDVSEQNILDKFKFNDYYLFNMYKEALCEVIIYSYIDGIFDKYNLETINKYISNIKLINGRLNVSDKYKNKQEERFIIGKIFDTLLEYVKGNKEESIKISDNINLNINFDNIREHGWTVYFKSWIQDLKINKNKF